MNRPPLPPCTLALALAPFFVAGCTLGPNHSRPAVAPPIAWKEPAAAITAPLPSAWWEVFGDPELNRLVEQAIAANHDLQHAAARVTEARALVRLGAAEFVPHLSADSAGGRFRTSANRAGGVGPAVTAGDFSTQLGLSYELDFFGRVRRSAEAARADAKVVAADFQVAHLLVTAETAGSYHQLRALDAERTVLEATLTLRRDAVALQTTRHQAGLINEADVTRSRVELASIEAEAHALTRGRARLEHALAVLCGEPPANFSIVARATAVVLPEIPAGLPSALLQRRPDLAAAEAQVEAACARIGVAKADLFPRISLTSAAGFASAELASLLKADSRAWSFGPSVHLPIFDGGRNRANLQAAEARHEQSLAQYRSRVLTAFREVEDSLSDLSALAAQGDAAERALLAARDTAALVHSRYQQGLLSYLEVIDAQRAALHSERLVTQLRAQRLVSTVRLAQALGGGWSATTNTPALIAGTR